MVYFVQGYAPGHLFAIKIGVANDVDSRLRKLQACSPVRLVVLAVIEGDHNKEAQLHRWFKHLRVHGEWFAPGDDLLGFIAWQIHEHWLYFTRADLLRIALKKFVRDGVFDCDRSDFELVLKFTIRADGKRPRPVDVEAIYSMLSQKQRKPIDSKLAREPAGASPAPAGRIDRMDG